VRRVIQPEAFLANLPLFRALAPAEIARLAERTARRALHRGEVLFREGEPSTGIHALVYGRIKLASHGPDGRERIADLVAPGRTFGEAMMFLDKPYIVTATAVADSLVLEVGKEAVLAELTVNPRFASRIIGALAERIEGLVHELQDYALGTASRRFVAWLLRRAGAVAAEGTATITLSQSKRVLALKLNLSAEHLSRVLRELTSAGLIAVRGRDVTIADVARLRAWHRDEAGARPSSGAAPIRDPAVKRGRGGAGRPPLS
jgi:CRP-like cAMP-binding protein